MRRQTVLHFLLTEKCNKEIAQELDISIKTVKWHATAIYREFKVQDRIQLMAKLMTPIRDISMREYAA